MSKNEMLAAIKAGLTIPMKEMWRSTNDERRKRAIALGAKFDSASTCWVFPDQVSLSEFRSMDNPEPAKPKARPADKPVPNQAFPVPVSLPTVPKKAKFPVALAVPVGAVEKPKVTAEPEDPLGFDSGLRTLKLKPSRFVIVRTNIYSPNFRHTLSRSKRNNVEYGTEAITVRTVSEHTIINPEEHERATKLRGSVGAALRKFGTRIVDGLYSIPLDIEGEWDAVRTEQKKAVAEFNAESVHHKVGIDAVKLQAMTGEEELMARKVTYEIQRLFDEMKQALGTYDPETIRAAANELKYKSASLEAGIAKASLDAAVANAREVANTVAKAVKDKGELIDSVKRKISTSAVDSARMMFLKLKVPEEIGDAKAGASRFVGLKTIDPESLKDSSGELSPARAAVLMND